MSTGRIETDHKPETRSIVEIAAAHVCTEVCDPSRRLVANAHRYVAELRAKREAERSHLRDAVVKTAKEAYPALQRLPFLGIETGSLIDDLIVKINNLTEFESLQEKKDNDRG